MARTTAGKNADLAATALDDSDGDGVYTGTFVIPSGQNAYKFVVIEGGAIAAWEASADRPLNLDGMSIDVALDTSEWSQGLLFLVDMTPPLAGGASFDPATQYVAAVGSHNGWGDAPRDQSELTDPNGDNIYTGRYGVGDAGVAYKFTIRNN